MVQRFIGLLMLVIFMVPPQQRPGDDGGGEGLRETGAGGDQAASAGATGEGEAGGVPVAIPWLLTEAIKLHLPHVERVFDPSRKEKPE
jgi:hypothetical protein